MNYTAGLNQTNRPIQFNSMTTEPFQTCVRLAAAHARELPLESGQRALHLGLELVQVYHQALVVRDAAHRGGVVMVRRRPVRGCLRPAAAGPAAASAFPLVCVLLGHGVWVRVRIASPGVRIQICMYTEAIGILFHSSAWSGETRPIMF